MKTIFFLPALLMLVFAIGCDTQCHTPENPFLLNCWTHSYEEELQESPQIFRPCDYKTFGASRYRHRLILKENDEAQCLTLSPVDAHYMVNGTWQYDDDTKTLQVFNTSGTVVWTYEVVHSEPDKLVLTIKP